MTLYRASVAACAPYNSRSALIGGHSSLQRSRSYIGCRSSTVSPSKLRPSCIRLSAIDARPSYLFDLVVFASADSNVRQLRSSTTRAAAVKRSRTQFGRRAFSMAGPDIWNSLPTTICAIDSHGPTQPSVVPSRHICSAQHLTVFAARCYA